MMIGTAYALGTEVPVDKPEAVWYLAQSADRGMPGAWESLDNVWRELSTEQRDAAKRRLRDAGVTLPLAD